MQRDPCGETMTKANPLPLLGSGEKGLRIHDLVKAPANTMGQSQTAVMGRQ